MDFDPASPTLARLSLRVREEQWTDAAFAARGIETAEQWWDALAAEPALAPLLTERTRRFAGKQRQDTPPGFDVHVAALRDAGFREVDTIWQALANRVVLAVRRRPDLVDMQVIVRRQDRKLCASITCMIGHYVARRAKLIFDHPHNAV
jgi:hypothetical protein